MTAAGKFRARQAWTVARIELRRAFFSKRAFWVYLLALFPALVFFAHGMELKAKQARWSSRGLASPALIDAITIGQNEAEVLKQIGTTPKVTDFSWNVRPPRPPRPPRPSAEGGAAENEAPEARREAQRKPVRHRFIRLFDGERIASLRFEDQVLKQKSIGPFKNLEEDRAIFAGIFQYFYLRLAIFFGCLGIFMNLFRGEMLDKTLHFWFLAPARREVLLAGKYAAGLAAASAIFAGGALLCFWVMLWPHDAAQVQSYWQGPGAGHAFWYAVAAVLGCVGYGSVFLAAGLLLRNPIVPAAVLLLWESINPFLPALLQRLSVLYYLQSLCPVPAPMDKDAPAVLRLLLSPAAPASAPGAILGLLVVTGLVLWVASRAVRRLEISYGAE